MPIEIECRHFKLFLLFLSLPINHLFKYCLLPGLLICSLNLRAQQYSHAGKLLMQWDTITVHQPFDERQKALSQIIQVAEKEKDEKELSNAWRRMGILYKNNGQMDSAIETTFRAMRYAIHSGFTLGQASCCNQVGAIYYKLGDKKEALEAFLKAYSLYGLSNDARGLSDAGGNVAETMAELGFNKKKVLWQAIKSFQNRQKWGDTSDIGYNYVWLAKVDSSLSYADSAFSYLNIAESRFTIVGDSVGYIELFTTRGFWYGKIKRWEDALNMHKKAFNIAVALHRKADLPYLALNLSTALENNGDYLRALEFRKLSDDFKDSLLISSNLKRVLLYEAQWEHEKELHKSEHEKLILRNGLIFLCILSLFLIAGILFLRSKRLLTKKELQLREKEISELLQQQEISQVNAMLKGQDAERQRIAQELHDRLGSMLATVKLHFGSVEKSMDMLRKQQTESYQYANSLLDEACEEVRRISHDLYSGSLVRFGLKTALLQLIHAIELANTIRIQFAENDVPETIYKPYEVELYRISQELLSNTLKYSGASEVFIQLARDGELIIYSYEENGKGFDKSMLSGSTGIGYKNIENRLKKMNGTWTLDTKPGHGLIFIAEIPAYETSTDTGDHYG